MCFLGQKRCFWGGKNNSFAAKIANTRLTKILVILALAERLPTSATLSSTTLIDGRYIVISTLLAPLSTGQPECREAGSPVPSGPRFCQRSALPATGATYDGRWRRINILATVAESLTDIPRYGKTVAPPAAGLERKNRRVAALSPTCKLIIQRWKNAFTALHCFKYSGI